MKANITYTRGWLFHGLNTLLFCTAVAFGLAAAPVCADILFVSNSGNNTIEKFTPDGVGSVFASSGNGLSNPTFLAFTDDAGVPVKLANQTAVPEPSTYAMYAVLGGVAGLLFKKRRKTNPEVAWCCGEQLHRK